MQVESEEESESSDEEVSSATEVSTDSEFAREECAPMPTSPPAILVTEATPPAPLQPPDYPLSRTRSAGGLATKRALELKRKYLLGEPSPPAVRKSDSTSQLDTKLEAFRSTITEFQKLLHPAPTQPQKPIVTFRINSEEEKVQPMPDIIKNLCSDAPVDLLSKVDSPLCKSDWREPIKEERKEPDIESDSLSEDDSSHTETLPNQSVPRVEVHDEGGELIQLDSLMIVNSTDDNEENASGTATTTGPTIVAVDSESSESCRDATTLALTETELSDWAAESAVLDDCGFDEKEDRKRSKNPRSLSGPKLVHETKNISAMSHVCGKTSPTEPIVYSNALEHFEFADEGDQDPSIETPITPRNEGYMELIEDAYDSYVPMNDRSINFIERSFSETTVKPNNVDNDHKEINNDISDIIKYIDDQDSKTDSLPKEEVSIRNEPSNVEPAANDSFEKSNSSSDKKDDSLFRVTEESSADNQDSKSDPVVTTASYSDISPPLEDESNESKLDSNNLEVGVSFDDTSPPLASEMLKSQNSIPYTNKPLTFTNPCSIRIYAPAICRSASETFNRPNALGTSSPTQTVDWLYHVRIESVSATSPTPARDTIEKVQEIKKEREEQTEVVRRLVLERLGNGPRASRKSTRKTKASPLSNVPPPVPPPPVLPEPPPPVPPPPVVPFLPPPRPAPPLMSLPVTSSFSDPDLAHERTRKGILRSISNYLNRRLGPRQKVIVKYNLSYTR